MASEIALRENDLTPGRVKATLREHGWTWRSTGACAGLLGGVIAPLLGLSLSALAWLIGDWHGFHLGRDGAVLLFLTIPLLIFGAHCLDLLDKEDSETKSASRLEKGNNNDLGTDKESS